MDKTRKFLLFEISLFPKVEKSILSYNVNLNKLAVSIFNLNVAVQKKLRLFLKALNTKYED